MTEAREASATRPARQVVSVEGNRCVILAAPGIIDRAGSELASAVGRARLAALLVEESAPAERAEELRRLLTSAGFRVFDLALPEGEAALSLATVADLACEAAGRGLTPDDAICAIGGSEALSAASWLAGNWGSKAACLAIPTSLEALILASGTPLALSAGPVKGIVHCPPALSNILVEPELIEAHATRELRENAYALMVQSAFVESAKAFDLVVGGSEALATGDAGGLVDLALDTARARGRLASSSLASARRSLDFGLPLARGLAACLGKSHSKGAYLAEGMRFEARLAWQLAGLDPDVVFALDALLARFALAEIRAELEPEELLGAMKAETAKLTNRRMFILPRAVGRALPEPVEDDVLLEHLRAFCQARRPAPPAPEPEPVPIEPTPEPEPAPETEPPANLEEPSASDEAR